MITLISISQITREEFLEFKKYVEVQFTKTEEKFKAIEAQIQTSNQRIEDLYKKLNKRMDDLITYLLDIYGIYNNFNRIYNWIWFMEIVIKLEQQKIKKPKSSFNFYS